MSLTLLQSTGPGSFTLPGTFPPQELPPSLSSVSKTLHSCKVIVGGISPLRCDQSSARVATGPNIVLFGEI